MLYNDTNNFKTLIIKHLGSIVWYNSRVLVKQPGKDHVNISIIWLKKFLSHKNKPGVTRLTAQSERTDYRCFIKSKLLINGALRAQVVNSLSFGGLHIIYIIF